MGCDQQAGGCAAASSLAVTFTVGVVLRLPVFRQVGIVPTQLFAAPGKPLVPPGYSVPAIGDNTSVPLAFVNCPMRQIPFAFSLSGTPLATTLLIAIWRLATLSAFFRVMLLGTFVIHRVCPNILLNNAVHYGRYHPADKNSELSYRRIVRAALINTFCAT